MLKDLKVKTIDNESITINEIDFIGIDSVQDGRNPLTISQNTLCIRCIRGMIEFPLHKVKSIEFSISDEKHSVMVTSNYKTLPERKKK